MSLAIVYSRAQVGINAPLVTVEIHLSNGLPSLSIVGLPEAAVKESKDRVRSAIINSNFDFPTNRIIINLAPADLPKGGGRFDLAIAIGILAASDQIPADDLRHYEFLGELALSGQLRPIKGSLPASIESAHANRKLILPSYNADEANLPSNADILPAKHLLEICAHLHNQQLILSHQSERKIAEQSHLLDFSDIKGQQHAKRAFEIAAAGGHNLIMSGPPGTGKTMLASRLPSILPLLTEDQALEVASIQSISHQTWSDDMWRKPPFRSPHHTASAVSLVGGGSIPKPGEVTLAHNGVLFLDEFPEFQKGALESLREPLESCHITISRAQSQMVFPSNFQLIAAMNPCPCGYKGDESSQCQCSPEKIKRYTEKISGPILDRIDLQITVPPLPKGLLSNHDNSAEHSGDIRKRVNQARDTQHHRQSKLNSALSQSEIARHCQLSNKQKQLLENAVEQLGLSARAYHRILKVARTIADLGNTTKIEDKQLLEAISYRQYDRKKPAMRRPQQALID